MKETGSIEYAEKKATSLLQNAWDVVDSNLPESEAKGLLKELSMYLIERDL